MLPRITGEFRAISDPELRFAGSGMPVASFRAVADQKKKNEATGEWEDDKVVFARITAFKKVAENVAASIKKGDTVTVAGRLSVEEYERKDGQGKGTSVEIVADEIGYSLRWNSVEANRSERRPAANKPADPWSSQSEAGAPPF